VIIIGNSSARLKHYTNFASGWQKKKPDRLFPGADSTQLKFGFSANKPNTASLAMPEYLSASPALGTLSATL